MRACFLFMLLSGLWLLSGCSSDQNQSKRLSDMRMNERISRSVRAMKEGMGKNDPRYQSRYQKAMDASLAKDSQAKWLSRQKSRTQTLDNLETFKSRQFSTEEFARADAKSLMGREQSALSGKQSDLAKEVYEITESPMARQTAWDASRQARESGQSYRTRADVRGQKAMNRSKPPEFIVLPEQLKNPAYSEDEVRKLLGRD